MKTFKVILFLFFTLTVPSLCLAVDESMQQDPFYTQKVKQDIPPLDTIYEHVDPFSGNLSLVHTDIQLPGNGGLDLKIIRFYNSAIWGRRDQVVTPGLIAATEKSPLGIGWSMHMGILRNPRGDGSSNNFLPNNPIFELPDGSQQVFFTDKNNPGEFISKDLWRMSVAHPGTNQDIYTIISPTGTVYTAEFGTASGGYTTADGRMIGQVTSINNAADNAAITITYYRGSNTFINTINDSTGRTVTFNYNTDNSLNNIKVNSRTFSYSYFQKDGQHNFLTKFTPPVGNAWEYDYETSSDSYQLNHIKYPSGGIIDYTYENTSFATGKVNVSFRVVATKKTSGRKVEGGTWTYEYLSGGSDGDTTTIKAYKTTDMTTPLVTETHIFYGWGNTGNNNVWKVGLPVTKTYTGNLILSESYDWDKGTQISNDSMGNANWNSTGGWVNDTDICIPLLKTKTTTRDGNTYTTSYSNFDTYGNPKTTTETGDASLTRTSIVSAYWGDTVKNIVKGKPKDLTVTISGTPSHFSGSSSKAWQYDTNGNISSYTEDGVTTDFDFTSGNLDWKKWKKDGNTYTTTYTWTNGLVSKAVNPIFTESRTINSKGLIDDETNGKGIKTTKYLYDDNLRLTDIIPQVGTPIGNPTKITYAADSSTKTVTRGDFSTTYYYDGFGRPTGSLDDRGVSTTISYNAYGIKESTNSDITDKTEYDYFGRPTKVTDKDSYYETYAYSGDTTGSIVTLTDKNKKPVTYTYIAFGNPDEKYLVSVKDQDSKTTTYNRNVQGNVTNITQGSLVRSFSYDHPTNNKLRFLMSETNPETGTITYDRDEVGNMTGRTDSEGKRTYEYDSLNRLKFIKYGNPVVSTLKYDYDKANNRTILESPSAAIEFVYDSANRLTDKKETIGNKLYTTSFTYNTNDYLRTITYPSTGRVVTYNYNTNNEIESVTGFGGAMNTITYNKAMLPKTFSYSNGVSIVSSTTMTYNGRNLVTDINSGSQLRLTYDPYDSRGNLKGISNLLEPTKNQTFDYDNLSRLTTFIGAWGSGVYGYDTNGWGNRISKKIGVATTTYGYSPTDKNRLTSTTAGDTFDYYGNGALKAGSWGGQSYSFGYDHFGNLSNISSGGSTVATYGYDGDGMRVRKIASGKDILYHYDNSGKVLSETESNGNPIADYIYLHGKLIAKVVAAPTISVAPLSDSFGNVFVNTASASHTISVRNTGTANLVLGSIGTTGTDYLDFYTVNDGCSGHSLAPSAMCAFNVVFIPSSSGAKSAAVTIPSNDPLTPSFNAPINGIGVLPTLTVGKTGTGNGTITSSPAGISCGGSCSASYGTGTQVALSATPDNNSSFTGWSGGGCSGTGSCTIALNSDTTVTATFGILPPVAPAAAFISRPTSVKAPFAVVFTDQSQRATSWLWDFGDGTTGVEQNPTHTYQSRGTYTIRLTATNSAGSSNISKAIINYVDITSILNLLLSD